MVSPGTLKLMLNIYPVYCLGAAIHVDEIGPGFRYARVSMPLRFYNKNYVGTHFGGSLYSMVDPMYVLLLLNILGRVYIVWDKAANIQYKKPGKGRVTAEFNITDDILDDIYDLKPGEKKDKILVVDVKDEQGDVVAHVVKTIYVKRKPIKNQGKGTPSKKPRSKL